MRVWAPHAETVELVEGDRRTEMRPVARRDDGSGDGWFETAGGAEPSGNYRLSLDGGAPIADPRSPHQPDGVLGPSRAVAHDAFVWTDGDWRGLSDLRNAVFYELHVGTFTPEGTFDGVVRRLDHLVDLGVTVVELMPVNEFGGDRGWGYDGVGLYAPHHVYGGPDGLKRLVDACHRRGLAVCLDVVYNHLGPSGNHLPELGPYFTDAYRTPWGDAVNFDHDGSDEVRAFFVDNACMWLRDYHVDALRLDAVHAIFDSSARHFLEQLRAEVDALAAAVGRPKLLVAESDLNDPRLVTSPALGGYGLDAQWSDDFHHALHAALTGERGGYYADFGPLDDVASALTGAYVYAGRYSRFRRRSHGRPPIERDGARFLAYLQNHDQVGNRATGERSSHLLTPAQLRIAAALVLTSPFVPLLFMGEEWGASTPFQYFTDHADADLARAVSEGRRDEFAAFGWKPDDVPDPQDPATFERSRLCWEERDREPHRELLEWHRHLIDLRHRHPDELGAGPLDAVVADVDGARITVERGPWVVEADFAAGGVSVERRG